MNTNITFLLVFFYFVLMVKGSAQEGFEWVVKPGEYKYQYTSYPNVMEGKIAVEKNGKWGFIDRNGKLVVPCQFDTVFNVGEGLFQVKQNGKFGIVNANGQLVIPNQFDTIEKIYGIEGLFQVKQNGKFGIVNANGKLVVPSQFEEMDFGFIAGHLKVKQNGKWGLIDTLGKVIIQCQFEDIMKSSGEIKVARVKQNGKWGLIDLNGKLIIPYQYEMISGFTKAQEAAIKQNGKWGRININGKIVIPIKFDSVRVIRTRVAMIKENGKWGVINKIGAKIIPCQFEEFETYNNHKLIGVKQDGKWGLVDTTGKIITPCLFEAFKDYSFGTSIAVQQDGKWGLLDASGKTLAPCQFNIVDYYTYSESLLVEHAGKYGVIDKNGVIVIPCEFENLWHFSEGLAPVLQKNYIGFIDKTGKMVIPPQFEQTFFTSEGLTGVKQNGKWGFIDVNGKIVFPCQFEETWSFKGGATRIKQNGKYGVIDTTGKVIIPCQFEHLSFFYDDLIFTEQTEKKGLTDTIKLNGLIRFCRRPTITWQHPLNATLATTQTQHQLKACIESNCQISDISLYIDGQLQSAPSRDLVVKPVCSGQYFERLITLPPGKAKHKIELSITTPAGTFTSERSIQVGEIPIPPTVKLTLPPEKRIALVIGNNAYPSAPLRNPVNDAQAIKNQLQQLGFTVYQHLNVSFQDMAKAISDFGIKAQGYDLALVYYAGHGIQYGDGNFLVPIDAQVNYPETIPGECVGLDRILQNLAGAQVKVGVVILDACRTNPFKRNWVQHGREYPNEGLGQVKPPAGTIIAYAADANQTADDNPNESNGLYTSELLKNLKRPGLTLEQIFRATRSSVIERTKNTKLQEPAEYNKLVGGDVILNQN